MTFPILRIVTDLNRFHRKHHTNAMLCHPNTSMSGMLLPHLCIPPPKTQRGGGFLQSLCQRKVLQHILDFKGGSNRHPFRLLANVLPIKLLKYNKGYLLPVGCQPKRFLLSRQERTFVPNATLSLVGSGKFINHG